MKNDFGFTCGRFEDFGMVDRRQFFRRLMFFLYLFVNIR